jgi:hypothetical protein
MRAYLVLVATWACGSDPLPCPPASDPLPQPPVHRVADVEPALAALRAGRFDDAMRAATTALDIDPHHSRAAAIRAVSTYVGAADELGAGLREAFEQREVFHHLDHEEGRAMWTRFLAKLDAVDADLAIAARDRDFSLELCIACWERDWNHSGRIDDHDRHLLEIDYDIQGSLLYDSDPRRRPTFRFDVGDIDWARAMIAFQGAGAELALAYRWSELDKVYYGGFGHDLRIPLVDKGRVKRAKERILAGLAFAARCREEYLAETDDDREWVPNPHQHGAVPLAVDDALYARWAAILGDVGRLVRSEEGVSLREVTEKLPYGMGPEMPDAYIDVGKMLDEPQDIVFTMSGQKDFKAMVEQVLRGVLGHGYQEHMRASPLVGRLRHSMDELARGDETMSRKMRYLLWLN